MALQNPDQLKLLGGRPGPFPYGGTLQLPGNTRALGRLKPGEMNKTEKKYAERLELLKKAGEILWYEFEAITLKIANDTRYTPDFSVLLSTGQFEFHEVKGKRKFGKFGIEDDAHVKIKVAAKQFPFKFVIVWESESGSWNLKEY